MTARSGVEGVEELARFLHAMGRGRDVAAAFRAGALAGARPVRRRAAAILKRGAEDTGNLRRALLAQAPRRSRRFAGVAFVTLRSAKVPDYRRTSGYGNPANYAHLVELGAPSAGVPAQPFLRPALEQVGQSAGDAMLAAAAAKLEQLARREAGRTAASLRRYERIVAGRR
ncbi:MAG: hypothetical protein AAFX81_15990 [Pseudomonadota bacterium]